MMQRCLNQNRKSYKDYGARGIKPCQHIASTPASVIALIGKRPAGLELDRINNSLGYTCGHCEECVHNNWPLNIRWADRTTQARNRRGNVMITHDGLTMCRAAWAEKLGRPYSWVRFNFP